MTALVLATLALLPRVATPHETRAPFRPVATVAMADTLRGRVTDARGEGIPGARVTITELSAVVQADEGGAFAVSVPRGRYTILVEALGYASLTTSVGPGADRLELSLEPSPLAVDPLTVTATRQPTVLASSPLPVSILGEESLRREHGVSLARAVSKLAGVHALTTGGQIGKPVVRGLTGPRVLVLENGHRLEDYSWSDEDGPSIESRLEQRIEVIRGPASVLYGSDAIGGVINAIPAPLPDATGRSGFGRAEVELYGASNNREFGTALRYEGASGRVGWRGFVVGRKAEDLHTPNGELDNTGFGAVNGEVALGFHSGAGTSMLRYARYGGEFKLLEASGPVPGTDPGAEEPGAEGGPERKLSDDRIQYDGNYVLGGARLETKAQWQRHFISELSDELGDPDAPMTEEEVFNLVLSTWSGDALLYHGNDRLHGTVGLSGTHRNNDTRGEVPLVPDARTNTLAGFAFEQLDIGQVSLLGGARYEHRSLDADANPELGLADESRDYDVAVGDIGAVFHATDLVSFAGNVGRAWRAPSLFELFTDGPRLGEARFEIGDPDLTAETSLNLDASVRLASSMVHGELSAYRNRINDFIFVTPTTEFMDELRVFRYEQADATLLGAEASLEVVPTDALTLRGRYDFVRATNDETDEPIPNIPPRYGTLEAELHRADLGWAQRARLGVEAEIVAAKTRLAPDEEETGGYALLNLEAGATFGLFSRRLRVDMRLRNALDKDYRRFLSRYKEFASEPGRNLVIRLSTGF